jgi:hypothetical protein
MTRSRRLFVFALLALIVALLVVAIVLWQRGREYKSASVAPETSPLPAPTAVAEGFFSSRFGLAAALFWVVLGAVLALGIAFLILRRYK